MSEAIKKTKPDAADFQPYAGLVEELLPHRKPFLFIDRCCTSTKSSRSPR
jgi:hypothetical protein